LGNREKIDYVKETFGDSDDIGIMCHFIGERELLSKHFSRAKLYSSSAHAEGVDLSHLKHFIIYSSDYSGSKFIQRRDRIVNINGSNTNTVHHLLVKGAISEQVYNKVSKKEDFNNKTYERKAI
jgi:ERCC4-related helicase